MSKFSNKEISYNDLKEAMFRSVDMTRKEVSSIIEFLKDCNIKFVESYLIQYEWRGTSGVGKRSIETIVSIDPSLSKLDGPVKILSTKLCLSQIKSPDAYRSVYIFKDDDDYFYINDFGDLFNKDNFCYVCDGIDGLFTAFNYYLQSTKFNKLKKDLTSKIKSIDDLDKIMKIDEFIKTLG